MKRYGVVRAGWGPFYAMRMPVQKRPHFRFIVGLKSEAGQLEAYVRLSNRRYAVGLEWI